MFFRMTRVIVFRPGRPLRLRRLSAHDQNRRNWPFTRIASTSAWGIPHDSMTSFTEVFSLRRRSTLRLRVFDRTKKSRSPRKRRRTLNSFTLIRDSRVGVSVLKGGRTRATLELARSERFIFAEITIDLPQAQAATGIRDFPSVAAENFLKL